MIQMAQGHPHIIQERGQGSCQRGNKLACILYSDQLLHGDDVLNGEISVVGGTDECEEFNSAISPRRQVCQANTSQDDFDQLRRNSCERNR